MQRTLRLLGGLLLLSLPASPCWGGYVEEVTGDAPLSYWRLGESAGPTATDEMGNQTLNYNSFAAADFGMTGAISGDSNTSMQFRDAANTLMVTTGNATGPFSFGTGESFSIEYWLNTSAPANTSGNAGIVTKGYDTADLRPWYLSRLNTGKADFYLRNSTGTSKVVASQSTVNDGQWHHVVGVYDAADAEIRIWVDGDLQNTVGGVPEDAYGTRATSARPLVIGRHPNNDGVLDGLVDEVAIYGYALDNADAVGGVDVDSGPYRHFLAGAEVPAVAFDLDLPTSPTQVGFTSLIDANTPPDPNVFSATGGATITVTNPVDQHRDRGAGGTLLGHRLAGMLRDFTFLNVGSTDASNMLRLDVTELDPNTDYRVRVFSYDHTASNDTRSVWYEGTPASTALTDPTYRLVHRNISGKPDSGSFDLIMTSDATGQLTLHSRLANSLTIFNGMTVEKMPVTADLARIDVDKTNAAQAGPNNSTQLGYAGLAPGGADGNVGSVTSNGVTVTVSSDLAGSPTRYRSQTPEELFDDFIYADAQMNVQIDGLTPGTEYRITVHSQDLDGNASDASKWSIAGSPDTLRSEHLNNGTANTPVESWSFTTFVTPDSSSLSLVGEKLGGLIFLNGIEIAQAVSAGVAADVKYDFNHVAGHFSTVPDATGDTQAGFTAADLNTNGLLIDGVAVTLSPLGDGATLQSRDRTTPVDAPPGLTQGQLYDDFVFAYSNPVAQGAGMEIELAGLAANQEYDLTIWSFDSGSDGDRGAVWTDVTGDASVQLAAYTFNGSAPPTADFDNTITGRVTSDADGVVRVQGVNSSNAHGVFLNALELTAVPEPAGAVLLVLGATALAGCRLRRRR